VASSHSQQVAAEVAEAAIMATAVGARGLPDVATSIARGLCQRWEARRTEPTNIVICENVRHAPDRLREFVRDALPHELSALVEKRVGFVPAVIARMSHQPAPRERTVDPALILAEPYSILPVDRTAFVGTLPRIVGMEPVAPFAAYVDRKLYVHNASHAMLGYLGYHRGHVYGYEALDDPWIRPLLDRSLDEAGSALVREYGFEPVAFREHVSYLMLRLANRALGDRVTRLARDPLRKLAPGDRLVGAARMAEKQGLRPEGLSWGIAAALAYDNSDDPQAVQLQERVGQEGLNSVLRDVCHIEEDESLADLVTSHYRFLAEGPGL
jgi:mannitol-1-phosphate 5-dehydrogenase